MGGGIAYFSDSPVHIPMAFCGAIFAGLMFVLKPRWAFAGLVIALVVLEEFPSGQGETVERSTRTAFYAQSLGLGGLYLPDLWLALLCVLFVGYRVVQHQPLNFMVDKIGAALLMLAVIALLSITLSFVDGNPLDGGIVNETTGVSFKLNERALKLIALFQFKLFAMLFAAYVLGLVVFNHVQHIESFCRTFFVAAAICIPIGIARMIANPTIVTSGFPLFYDSPTSWFFALFAMFTVCAWAMDIIKGRTLFVMLCVSAALAFFVLVSFRRTMWGAIAFAAIPMLILLPSRARVKLSVILLVLGVVGLSILMLTPLRDSVLSPVLGRVEQTNIKDASTLYRLAIFVHVSETFSTIPLFGHGARPLWNEIAALGFFRTNMENVHSIFLWWFLRTGIVGVLVATFALGLVFYALWRAARVANPLLRTLGIVIFLALVMFLFSGTVNPVYAQVRYVVPLGLGLALASRILQFSRAPHHVIGDPK